jgi:hypothetical protein
MNFVKPEDVENKYNMTSTSKQFPAPQHSGRVPNMNDPSLQENSARSYSLYDTKTKPIDSDMRRQLVGTMHKSTPLNDIFFSSSNLDLLQSRIQEQVFQMSGSKHRIDRQNDDDLKLIMRSYYLMFGKNDPTRISQDLEDLNARVVGYASAKIFSELDFYLFYRKDIEDFAPPIANPMNSSVYGTRSGELKSFF